MFQNFQDYEYLSDGSNDNMIYEFEYFKNEKIPVLKIENEYRALFHDFAVSINDTRKNIITTDSSGQKIINKDYEKKYSLLIDIINIYNNQSIIMDFKKIMDEYKSMKIKYENLSTVKVEYDNLRREHDKLERKFNKLKSKMDNYNDDNNYNLNMFADVSDSENLDDIIRFGRSSHNKNRHNDNNQRANGRSKRNEDDEDKIIIDTDDELDFRVIVEDNTYQHEFLNMIEKYYHKLGDTLREESNHITIVEFDFNDTNDVQNNVNNIDNDNNANNNNSNNNSNSNSNNNNSNNNNSNSNSDNANNNIKILDHIDIDKI